MGLNFYSLDDKYNEISENVHSLYSYLHILKIYTSEKGLYNQDISNIDEFVDVLITKIENLSHCI